MNFDELGSSASPNSINSQTDTLDTLGRPSRSTKETVLLPAISSDNEWVSPFTVLPPLPTLRKSRPQSHQLRSPEQRLHERSISSAYYAAAWGSPYATPSPNTSPSSNQAGTKGQEVDIASPLATRDAHERKAGRASQPTLTFRTGTDTENLPGRQRARSWDREQALSERFNWLSESDHSDVELGEDPDQTPQKQSYFKPWVGSHTGSVVKKGRASQHHIHDSIATITPETFNGTSEASVSHFSTVHRQEMEQEDSEGLGLRPGSNPVDKPLPNLPARDLIDTKNDVALATEPSPQSPSRPKIMTAQSFQRPKKKVMWKNRTCVIALPLTDREDAGLPPVLDAQESKARIQRWIDAGYDVSGFTLAAASNASAAGSGQSKSPYPDPAEMRAERKNSRVLVRIPNQAEWDAWVDYLKEEKLRALGVTPSNSEAPLSTQSPFSSSLSRVSSQFPSLAASPPIGTLSANGNHPRIAGNTFSPALSHPGGMSSHGGSHVTSPFGNIPGGMHGYKQSIAYVNGQPRMKSPFDFQLSQQNVYNPGLRQTPNGLGVRQFSPPAVANVQSLGQVLSPAIPALPIAPVVPSNDPGQGSSQPSSMEQIRQQQQRQQQMHSQMLQSQHQRQQSLFPQPPRSAELPRTPVNIQGSPTRSAPPEIMHPTPRSHRHNLSAALQKGVDDAEAARSSQSSIVNSEKGQNLEAVGDKHDHEENADDQEQEELPVLKRPETLGEADEQSEIETNPSIAASPLLMDDEKNPFSNLGTLDDIVKAHSDHKSHKPTQSISKFNVEAPAFNPSKGFSFVPAAAARTVSVPPQQVSSPISSGRPAQHTANTLSISKFNIEAPAFVPSYLKHDTPHSSVQSTPAKDSTPGNKSTFTFGSPAFNVEAPEFKPGQTFSFSAPEFQPGRSFSFADINNTVANVAEPNSSNGSIFGNVVVDASTKVNRRGTKVLAISKPRSREGTPVSGAEDDEQGRLRAPTERQKRARRGGDDGDQAPTFADSAPFDHDTGLVAVHGQQENTVLSNNEISEVAPDRAKAVQNIDRQEAEQGMEQEIPQIEVNQTVSMEPPAAISPSLPQIVMKQEALEPDNKVSNNTTNTTDDVQVVEQSTNAAESLARSEQNSESDTDDVVEVIEETSDGGELVQVLETKTSRPGTSGTNDTPLAISDVQTPTPANTQKTESVLSALAAPFEFKPVHESLDKSYSEAQPSQEPHGHKPKQVSGLAASRFAEPLPSEPRIASGLQASRFAASPPSAKPTAGLGASKYATARSEPSPPPSQMSNRKASADQELYEYVQPTDLDRDLAEQGLLHESPEITSSSPTMAQVELNQTSELMRSVELSGGSRQATDVPDSPSQTPKIEDNTPSYEEIDAVMRQFEDNPDLGVERDDTPVKSTPLIDMRMPPPFRSDAPSPSPRRHEQNFKLFNPQRGVADLGLGIHRLNNSLGEVSDWGNEYSPEQEQKIHSRAGFFDEHVNDIVDGLLEHRLGPLEQSLSAIQNSLASITSKPKHRQSLSTDKQESDADDEDEYDAYEGFSQLRSRSPGKRDRKADAIRSAVADALVAYQQTTSDQSVSDLQELRAALDEMRHSFQNAQQKQLQPDFRAIVEDIVSNHPRFESAAPVRQELQVMREALELKIDALESSLKRAERHADGEVESRKHAEENIRVLNHRLSEAQENASKISKANEEAQATVEAFLQEKAAYANLRVQLEDAQELNNEYRLSKKDWDQQIEHERTRNRDLAFTLKTVRQQHDDQDESRKALQDQVRRLQERMAEVMQDISSEESEWRKREQEYIVQHQKMQSALDHEVRHREKAELELDDLDKEHKENMRFRVMHEHGQQEISRLHNEIAQLREAEMESLRFKTMHEQGQQENARLHNEISQLRTENKTHQDTSFKLERQLTHANEMTDVEVAKHTARMQAEIDAASNLRSDHEAQIERLKARLDTAEIDLEDQKANHDSAMAEAADAHNQALREANEKRENSLEEQHTAHQTKLNDLRERHTRALHNSSDDRHRLEYHLNEKLALSEDKAKHLESKLADLEERLEITKSAARAAVEAATAKGIDLPTPAPSVIASPPQRVTSASVPIAKDSDLPEKISPQALRESIMVLQDQLQNREQKIEVLEHELAAVDRDAPTKIKERESEITMLRELLAVRVDDLGEIISTVSKPDFDRDTVRDAAIRLKATLQMEQQLKERAAAIGNLANSLPSISTITSYAQSPRALPMAAVAAFGSWRKAKDSGVNAFNNMTGNLSEQTPSKSKNASPPSFMSGIMTPPSTSQRTPTPNNTKKSSPPSMRPLAGITQKNSSTAGPAPRPLRSYTSQPRTLSSQQAVKRRNSAISSVSQTNKETTHAHPELPRTPLAMNQKDSSVRSLDFDDDVDEDASPFDDGEQRLARDIDSNQSVDDESLASPVPEREAVGA